MSDNSPVNFSKFFLALGGLVLSSYSVYSLVNNIPKANAATPCIVTLYGVRYDVSPLQTTGFHPGGNIFICGTDMTTVYASMHGTDVTRMIPYLYTAPTPTVTPSPSVTPTPSPSVTPTPTPETQPTPTTTITPSPTPGNHIDDQNESDDNDKNEVNEEKDEDSGIEVRNQVQINVRESGNHHLANTERNDHEVKED